MRSPRGHLAIQFMVNSRLTRRLTGVIALAVLAFCGCGGSDWGYLSGTVLLNGQPVGPGSITLEPVNADRAGAVASFGTDGKYSVISAGRKEGAPAGEYRVTIHGGAGYGEEAVGPRPKSPIPARYGNPNTTDLTVTIEPGEKVFDFNLKP
jgi:hypothetical protein